MNLKQAFDEAELRFYRTLFATLRRWGGLVPKTSHLVDQHGSPDVFVDVDGGEWVVVRFDARFEREDGRSEEKSPTAIMPEQRDAVAHLSDARIGVLAARAGTMAVGMPATRDEERAMAVEIIGLRQRDSVYRGIVARVRDVQVKLMQDGRAALIKAGEDIGRAVDG